MSYSKQEDFPESTLNDDDSTWNRASGRRKNKAQGKQRDENPLWRASPEGSGGQTGSDDGYNTPQLRPTWARPLVNIDQSSLTSIGRANSKATVDKRWNQGRQTNAGGRDSTSDATGRAPPRQETPFVQGVNVLQKKQPLREEETTRGNQVNRTEIIELEFDPSKESKEAHPYQLRPTPTMYKFAQALFKRKVTGWKLSEILTPGSSDGRSILISAFVDFVSTTLMPEIKQGQQASVAQIAVVTAPSHILGYLQDANEARGYLNWVLSFDVKIPPLLEHQLCPLDTPNLIEKQSLRASIRSGDLDVVDQKHVIEVFVKCYYPKSVAAVMEAIDPLDQIVLRDYIERPGLLLREMKTRRKPMQFAPPKWYRLSIHPDTKIQATPRQSPKKVEGTAPQVSIADIELKTRMSSKELTELAPSKMRTAILTAIPLIFDERLTRVGCSQAFSFFEAASHEEMLDFFRKDNKSQEEGEKGQLKEAVLYRHLLRFEHIDRKKNGEWNVPAREILRKWINIIHPILVANNFSLLLSIQPFSRTPLDRLILMTPYSLETQEIDRHVISKRKSNTPTRFEVWFKSSCRDLKDMTNVATAGPKAEGYSKMLKDERISVVGLYSSIDEQLPITFIVGSISTADDRQIAEEIVDRLVVAGFAQKDIPHFHIASTIVSTSTGKVANRTKCIIAAKADAPHLQDMISELHTPTLRDYLVTRDYHFTQIVYPPTDRSDKDLALAMDRQQEFTSSIVRTSIYGFEGFEPFYDIPRMTKDLCTREITSNTSTVAYHLLTMRMQDDDELIVDAPVIRVSMSKWNDKIYLTALKKDAAELIRFTAEVMKLMDIWYQGHEFKLMSEVIDAQRVINATRPLNPLQQQALSNVSAVKSGVTSEAQREIEASRTAEALVSTATKGITETFVQGTVSHFDEAARETNSKSEQQEEEPGLRDIIDNETDSIRKDIQELKGMQITQSSKLDEIATIMRKVLEDSEARSRGNSDMMSTITTMLETNKSSVSSVSEVAASCRGYFKEHSTTIQDMVQANSKEIMKACLDRPQEGKNMEVLEQLIARHEQAAEKTVAAERAMAERYDSIVTLLQEQKDYIRQWGMQTPSETSIDYGMTDEEPTKNMTDEEITQSILENYSTDVRQHARELLALHETMPYTKLAIDQNGQEEKRPASGMDMTESQTAPKDVCNRCNKKDLMLIYCDKCPDPVDLYHASCLEYVAESKIRICQECVSGVENRNTPPTSADQPTKTNDVTQSTETNDAPHMLAEVASHHSEFMSISSTSSDTSSKSASSSSSVASYKPTYTATPRTRTLPHLNQTKSTQPKPTEDISPIQTRGQRAKKTRQREDAFDTSSEEESDK